MKEEEVLQGQLSLFDEEDGHKGCCRADMMFRRLWENVVQYDFYCSECGEKIGHCAPRLKRRETCPHCGRLVTAVHDREYYIARGETMPERV